MIGEVARAYVGVCAGYLVLTAPAISSEVVTVNVDARSVALLIAFIGGIAAYFLASVVLPKIHVVNVNTVKDLLS